MPSLNQLPEDQLTAARSATDAVMKLKAYLPSGLLLMLLGRWRDEAADALGIERRELPSRGKERRTLDQLTTTELTVLSGAVGILTEVRFTSTMDDPELPRLLREFGKALIAQKTDREQIRASIAS